MVTKHFWSSPQNEKRNQNKDAIFPFTYVCLHWEQQHYVLTVDKHCQILWLKMELWKHKNWRVVFPNENTFWSYYFSKQVQKIDNNLPEILFWYFFLSKQHSACYMNVWNLLKCQAHTEIFVSKYSFHKCFK